MSLRDPVHQIELEMEGPAVKPATIVRIWIDDDGNVQSQRVDRSALANPTRRARGSRKEAA